MSNILTFFYHTFLISYSKAEYIFKSKHFSSQNVYNIMTIFGNILSYKYLKFIYEQYFVESHFTKLQTLKARNISKDVHTFRDTMSVYFQSNHLYIIPMCTHYPKFKFLTGIANGKDFSSHN